MIKNMTRFEKVIPMIVSRRIALISPVLILGIPLPIDCSFPSSTSSSTSSSACQKKRYGDIVVPNRATIFMRYFSEKSKCGIMLERKTTPQSCLTKNTTTIYAQSDKAKYLRYLEYTLYETNTSRRSVIAVIAISRTTNGNGKKRSE